MLNAGYLTLTHLQGGEAGCFLIQDCDIVLQSEYSELFNIPVAAFGLIYYAIIFFATLLYNINRSTLLIRKVAKFTTIGLLVSFWFIYLQAFVIGEFCVYCMVSAATSIVLFLLGMYVLKKGVDSYDGEMIKS